MQEVYRETLLLRSGMCDLLGAWRPGSILEVMQETAGEHSALFGLDRKIMDEMGICWVLSRVKVVLHRTPKVYEKIEVETYPLPQRHLFFPRVHVFRDAEGQQVGCGSALWVLMDKETRKITANATVSERLPKLAGKMNPAGMPATVRLPDGVSENGEVLPRFSELDLNRHVNNTRYLDWCQNALGLERLMDREIASFEVNYDAEVLPGTHVQTALALQEDYFAFGGFEGEKQLFAVGGILRSRG